MSTLTPAQRTQRARIAAKARWSGKSAAQRRAETAPGLRAMAEHFERQVDPEGLPNSSKHSRQAKNAQQAQRARIRLAASRNRSLGVGGDAA